MADRLDELATLVAIIDAGSLAGAARRLRRSPAAVTRTLAGLEERAGTRLIERSTRRLAATAAGRLLADDARRLLGGYEAALERVVDAPLRGLLRVTAPVQFGRLHVAKLVDGFLDRHPQISVELVLNDRNLDLIEEGLDVAIRIGPLADSTLRVRRVGEVRRVLVASPAYLARRAAPRRPRDLAAHDTMLGSARQHPPEWRFGPGARGTAVRLAPRLMVNDVAAMLLAVRAGRGIGRALSYQVAEDIAAGRLVRLLPEFEPPPLPVQLVTSGGTHPAPKTRAFLDHAASDLLGAPGDRCGGDERSRGSASARRRFLDRDNALRPGIVLRGEGLCPEQQGRAGGAGSQGGAGGRGLGAGPGSRSRRDQAQAADRSHHRRYRERRAAARHPHADPSRSRAPDRPLGADGQHRLQGGGAAGLSQRRDRSRDVRAAAHHRARGPLHARPRQPRKSPTSRSSAPPTRRSTRRRRAP